ncbi:MAG: hypothetical protein KAY24_10545 [Candidatus Eisenbacteria sp.]|nr:hypothetical protein [Candidatus Eisenbacteria bacterium]
MTGHTGRARLFFTAEAGILASYIVFQGQGHVRRDRYIDYAELFAGVSNIDGKEDFYYRNLGKYDSNAEYEDEIARSARAMYGEDLEKRLAYVDQYKPGPDEAWEWASIAHREMYLEMRKDSRNSFRWADNMLGVLLLNHVLSAVDAARSAQGGRPKSTLYATYGQEGRSYVGLSWDLQ